MQNSLTFEYSMDHTVYNDHNKKNVGIKIEGRWRNGVWSKSRYLSYVVKYELSTQSGR